MCATACRFSCFISSFNLPQPFQPLPFHDHRYRYHPSFLPDLWCSNRLTPDAFPSLLLPYSFHWLCFAAIKQRRSNQRLIYQELHFRGNLLLRYHSRQISPFRPCLCHSVLHVFPGYSSVYRSSSRRSHLVVGSLRLTQFSSSQFCHGRNLLSFRWLSCLD